MERDLNVFLCKVFIVFEIITFLESKFEEAGWTANSSKKYSKNLPKIPSNRRKIVVWGWFWVAWERLGDVLGPLGASWAVLGASWGRPGAILGRLAAVLGRLGVELRKTSEKPKKTIIF